MPHATLQGFYDRKYGHERDGARIETIPAVEIPTTRFEAAVKFFPRYFAGGDVLELGAGNGSVAKALLGSSLPISSYTLGDISRPRLEGLSHSLSDRRVRIVEMDAEAATAAGGGLYDGVIMVALVEHLVDPLGALRRIRALLKPGGIVYIDTPNVARYTHRLRLLFGRFPATSGWNEGLTTYDGQDAELHDEGHLHYFTYRSLSLMLTERCGFSRVVKLSYPGGRIPLGKHVHSRLARLWPEMFSELAVVARA